MYPPPRKPAVMTVLHTLEVLAHVLRLPRGITRQVGKIVPILVMGIHCDHGIVGCTATQRPRSRIEYPGLSVDLAMFEVFLLLLIIAVMSDPEIPANSVTLRGNSVEARNIVIVRQARPFGIPSDAACHFLRIATGFQNDYFVSSLGQSRRNGSTAGAGPDANIFVVVSRLTHLSSREVIPASSNKLSADFPPIHAHYARRIVAVVAPGGMAEVDDEIAVVRSHGVIEDYSSDAPPIFESAPFKGWQASRRSFVGHFDIESKGTLGLWIALVENLRHDLVAKIQPFAFDPGLLRRDQQAHNLWRAHGFAARVAQLGDLVELALGRLFIDALENRAGDEQHGQCPAAPPCPGVGCVANLCVVDIVAVVSAKILLSDEICSAKRLGMIGVHRGIELAHQR